MEASRTALPAAVTSTWHGQNISYTMGLQRHPGLIKQMAQQRYAEYAIQLQQQRSLIDEPIL